jgi:hypothetical protein
LGLANLRQLPAHDREAAAKARLAGRALEPWGAILATAHWLQESHGVAGLFERMEKLSVAYQAERGEYEENDTTRVLLRALLELTEDPSALRVQGPYADAAIQNQENRRPARHRRAAGVIKPWFAGLAMRFHPDRGGSHAAMVALNEAHDRLRELVGLARR